MINKFILIVSFVALAYARYPLTNKDEAKPQAAEKDIDKKAVTDFENKWCDYYKMQDLKGLEAMYIDPFYYAEHTKLFTSKKDYMKDLEAFIKTKKDHTCKQEFVSISGCESEVVVVGRWFDYDNKGKVVEEQFFVDVLRKNEKGEYQFAIESIHQVGNYVILTPEVQVSPKPEVQVSPKPGVQVSPKPGVEVSPKPGVQVSPQPGAKVPQKLGVQGLPQPGVKVSQKPGVKVSPKPEVTVSPKPVDSTSVKETSDKISATVTPANEEQFEYSDDDSHSTTEKPDEIVEDLDD